ncbi:MAG: rhodanese-like domain-containing protein [Vicinamibacteria bacterium]
MAMRWSWSRLSLNQKLAAGALALGLLALFARPDRGNVVTIDVKELASIIDKEGDHVTAGELGGWIVAGRSDYRLIDLRNEKEYAEYHIPTAESVTLTALPDAPLQANEKIVLYSEGGIHASQAWMLLRAKGFKNVYTLKGGLDQWKEDILFPRLAENETPQERARFERAAALAKFFGGSARTGATQTAAAKLPETPKVEAPAPTAGATSTPPKKKKEGC